MLNLLISTMLLLSSVMMFSFGYRYNGIHRTFLLLDNGVIDQGVYFDEATGETPYFQSGPLEEAVHEYFNDGLRKFTERYWLSFYYYEPANFDYCLSECQAVQIHLVVELAPLGDYDHYLTYVITKHNAG